MQEGVKRKYEDLVDSFTCPVCLCVCKDPVQCERGCIGCRECFDKVCISSPTHEFSCPVCRSSDKFFPNLIMKNLLSTLKVKCENISISGKKCNRTILVGEADNHDQICPEKIVACKNIGFGCKETLHRKRMSSHEEECIWSTMVECDTCNISFRYGTHSRCHLSSAACAKCGEMVDHPSFLLHTATCAQEETVCFWPGCLQQIPSTEHVKRNPVHGNVDGLVMTDIKGEPIQFANINFVLPKCPECQGIVNKDCETCMHRCYTVPPLKIYAGDKRTTTVNISISFFVKDGYTLMSFEDDRPLFEDGSELCLLYSINPVVTSDTKKYKVPCTKIITKMGKDIHFARMPRQPKPDGVISVDIYIGISNSIPPEEWFPKIDDFIKSEKCSKNVKKHLSACKWTPAGSFEYIPDPQGQ